MSSDSSLSEQVKTNLSHYNLWTDVREHSIKDLSLEILSGIPPSKLDSNDIENQREWIIPKLMSHKANLTLKEINSWFVSISNLVESNNSRPKRVTIGLVNDDGTVVYYFIHDGVVKPRQN